LPRTSVCTGTRTSHDLCQSPMSATYCSGQTAPAVALVSEDDESSLSLSLSLSLVQFSMECSTLSILIFGRPGAQLCRNLHGCVVTCQGRTIALARNRSSSLNSVLRDQDNTTVSSLVYSHTVCHIVTYPNISIALITHAGAKVDCTWSIPHPRHMICI
jgi:hypothetical protein